MNARTTNLLQEYVAKRNFNITSEPGAVLNTKNSGDYMIHLHEARRKHYDLRLQWKGVLKSWAVPKGPSYDSNDKRLAVRTEDHPDEYKSYEGVIPKGNYGAGPSLIWDAGEFIPLTDFDKGLKKGHIKFFLAGVKLVGVWNLVRIGSQSKKENWLLIKDRDDFDERAQFKVDHFPESVASGRTAADLRNENESSEPIEATAMRPNKRKYISSSSYSKAIAPQLAYLQKVVPQGDWTYERKFDGYRILAHIDDKSVKLITRNGKDWSEKLANLAKKIERLGLKNAVLDGEIVYYDKNKQTSFAKLQNFLQEDNPPLDYVIFDILFLEDQNLQSTEFHQRRRLLEKLFKKLPKVKGIELSQTLPYSQDMLAKACAKGWEGVVAKDNKSVYHNFRHRSWVKVKCGNRGEYLIVGLAKPQGARLHFGSLLLAEETPNGLIYRGRVGTGFDSKKLRDLYKLFKVEKVDEPPAIAHLNAENVLFWTRPRYYAEIDFTEQSPLGILRHPVFFGLRKDKEFSVSLTHPERIFYKEDGITKKDLWDYYQKVMSEFLKFAKQGPLSLVRCPQGYDKTCFFQKHMDGNTDRPPIVKIKEKNKKGEYRYLENGDDVKALVQLGVLEFHLWNCRAPEVEEPQYVVFDLDPGPGIHFDQIIAAAKRVRAALQAYGKKSYVRTTGGKGLHVLTEVVGLSWDEAYDFSKALAQELESKSPQLFVTTMTKAKRKNKIFIDYFRNSKGSTSIANFSTRAREGAPVATPLFWRELKKGLDPSQFTVRSIPQRLKRLRKDPWKEFWKELKLK